MTQGLQVPTHSHSVLSQLARPSEVLAMLRYKLAGKKALADPAGSRLDKQLWTHLSNTSRSFAAVIRVLPPSTADAVCVFYLLLRALDTLEDDMTLEKFAPLALGAQETWLQTKQRLVREFWSLLRPAAVGAAASSSASAPSQAYPLDQIMASDLGVESDRALLHALPLLLHAFHHEIDNAQAKQAIVAVTREMGEGMAEYCGRDLRNGTADESDYTRYCHIVAGTVGYGLTMIFHGFALEQGPVVEQEWDAMGIFLQRTNITRDVCEDAFDGRGFWPQSIWTKSGCNSLKELKDVRILNAMVANALALFPLSAAYLDRLENAAVFRFCALPQAMAVATLAELYNNPLVYTGVVKIRSGVGARLALALDSNDTAQCKRGFNQQAVVAIADIRSRALAIADLRCVSGCDAALSALGARAAAPARSVAWVNLAASLVILIYVSWASQVYLGRLGLDAPMAETAGGFGALMLVALAWKQLSAGPARALVANVVGTGVEHAEKQRLSSSAFGMAAVALGATMYAVRAHA